MSKISVIIPTRNAEDKIGHCIEALLSQTLKPFEIIVVDGNSTDHTIDIIKKFPVKLLFESYRTIGGARQEGVLAAKGDYVAFTDADCIPLNNWLESLIADFSEGLIGIGGGVKNVGNGLWEMSVSLALGSYLGSGGSVQDCVPQKKMFVKSLSGCNCLYKKIDLINLGGFDVTLSINEDTELNKRLLIYGPLLYTPNAIVIHNQNRNVKAFIKRMYSFGKSRASNRLWDVHAIPPLIGLFTMFLPFINIYLFIYIVLIYISIVILFSFKTFLHTFDLRYLISLPLVYIIEHVSYSAGFLMGIWTVLK